MPPSQTLDHNIGNFQVHAYILWCFWKKYIRLDLKTRVLCSSVKCSLNQSCLFGENPYSKLTSYLTFRRGGGAAGAAPGYFHRGMRQEGAYFRKSGGAGVTPSKTRQFDPFVYCISGFLLFSLVFFLIAPFYSFFLFFLFFNDGGGGGQLPSFFLSFSLLFFSLFFCLLFCFEGRRTLIFVHIPPVVTWTHATRGHS